MKKALILAAIFGFATIANAQPIVDSSGKPVVSGSGSAVVGSDGNVPAGAPADSK